MRKILLVICAVILGLIICESFLRIFIPSTTLKFYQNPIIGSALKPNQSGIFVTQTNEYITDVVVNSHGWPDIEHPYDKPENVYRILILGDSFVENWQVPLEQRFFRQLQNKLGDKYEIIALGRGNTGTYHQSLILKNYGLKYKPDLVIHMFLTANDIKNNSPVLHPEIYNIKESSKLKNYLKQSRIVELLLTFRQKYRENKQNSQIDYPIDYHIYDQNYTKNYQTAWETTQKLILDTKKITEDSKAKYLLVTLANNEQVNAKVLSEIYKKYPKAKKANLDLEKPDKLIANLANEEKINLFQMLPFYKEYAKNNSNTPTYFFYDGHWTKEGTDLAAKLLFDQIISQNQGINP